MCFPSQPQCSLCLPLSLSLSLSLSLYLSLSLSLSLPILLSYLARGHFSWPLCLEPLLPLPPPPYLTSFPPLPPACLHPLPFPSMPGPKLIYEFGCMTLICRLSRCVFVCVCFPGPKNTAPCPREKLAQLFPHFPYIFHPFHLFFSLIIVPTLLLFTR